MAPLGHLSIAAITPRHEYFPKFVPGRYPSFMVSGDLRIRERGHSVDSHLTRDSLRVHGGDPDAAPISLSVAGKTYEFLSGTTRVFQLDDAVPKHALLKTEYNVQLDGSARSP